MRARTHIGILLGIALSSIALLAPAAAQADFGLESYSVTATDREGNPEFRAGSHPYKYTVAFRLNQTKDGYASGRLRDLNLELPQGLVGNPRAVPVCTAAQFDGFTPQCPADTQIGTAKIELAEGAGFFLNLKQPVYNRVAPLGFPASLGFSLFGYNSFQEASVRTSEDYGLTVADFTIPTGLNIAGIRETIWGVPADPGHDSQRGSELFTNFNEPVASDVPPRAYLTLPPSCNGPLKTTISIDSLENPGVFESATVETSTGLDGCNKLEFEPSLAAQPTTNLSDSPTGLDVSIHQPGAVEVEAEPQGSEFCSPGSWTPEPTAYSYQWLRNGAPISGATSNRYEPQPADAGTNLQCEVTAQNDEGAGVSASFPRVVPPKPDAELPESSGRPHRVTYVEESEVIYACEHGGWRGDPSPTFSYQWFADGSPLPGKTEEFIAFPTNKVPPAVQCRVKGENASGAAVAFTYHVDEFTQLAGSGAPDWESTPELYEPIKESPLAPSNLKDAKVKLPEGMSLNPAAGNGLGSCDEQQIGYEPKDGKVRFSDAQQQCPDAAKLGTFEVSTPRLLDHKLEGGVYLAKPYDNPFGSLLAIYLTVEDERTGIYAKLGGKVEADPVTGQLTTTFTENPNLPLEDIDLHLFNGRRAALTTPLVCGTSTITSELVPWSSPEGQTVTPSSSFQTSVAASGTGACPTSEATAPNAPAFSAGTIAPQAGAFSPFLLRLVRQNGSQRITGVETTLPGGLTGRLAGIPYCPEASIALARSREAPNQGAIEQASPSCPAASELGTITAGAGSGISPLYVNGHAYLAGPYKGAPLSIVSIVPAVAGPFDLGDVVTRIALYVNPATAQIHAVSDPLPTIIDGIPLDLRSIELRLDRPGFTLNPTSCEQKQITGTAISATGQSAPLANSFQVGGCKTLGFKPKLALQFSGAPPRRGGHPKLRAVLTTRGGDANIGAAVVTLPKTEFLENAHIRTVCTRVQYAANSCPAKSIYGYAKAWSPLLDQPLQGPVYLRSSSNKLPDLVASLDGQVHVDLDGRIDSVHSRIRNSFEAVPDTPVSKFELNMQGGSKGLLVNNTRLCQAKPQADVKFTAQNGKLSEAQPLVKVEGCKKAKKKKK